MEGEEHEFTSILTSGRPAYRVGQEVRVLYDPAHIEKGGVFRTLGIQKKSVDWLLRLDDALFPGIGNA